MQEQKDVVEKGEDQITEITFEKSAPDFEVIKVEGCLSSTSL